MYDSTQTIRDFLSAAAAKQPIPGGGSITALVGALAASMGEMVLNYSVGKKNLIQFDDELKKALTEFTRLRAIMVELMLEDQQAYQSISALRKLPEDSAERKANYPATLLACITIPHTIATSGLASLKLCEQLIDKANVYLLSDLAVCAELSMAAIRCGIYNVRVNLGESSAAEKKAMLDQCDQLQKQGVALISKIIPEIWARIEK